MHVELMVIGAHTGEKLRDKIVSSAARGVVVLAEPVPHLFEKLEEKFSRDANIVLLPACIAPTSGPVAFFAPKPGANSVFPCGDQLGSLNERHAIEHHPRLHAHIEKIEAEGLSFADLIDRLRITSIKHLHADTEGHDCAILQEYPFSVVRPDKITFEFKHSDGTFNVGRNLARLLLKLDDLQYAVRVVDAANMRAVSKI